MAHPNWQKIVEEAKTRITEIPPEEAKRLADDGAVFIDVREPDEFAELHAHGARNLSRGVAELEIGDIAPEPSTPIICYCGKGGRGAITADALQKLGYTNVKSIRGGLKAWEAAGFQVDLPRTA